MRNHPKALEREGITPERYQELMYICRQYGQCKRAIRRDQAGLAEYPGRRTGRSGAWKRPDPTGNAAAASVDRTAWYRERLRLIDGCARAAAGSAIAPALIECVTEGRAFDTLRRRPPCGRQMFYKTRLLFFILLDARLRGE